MVAALASSLRRPNDWCLNWCRQECITGFFSSSVTSPGIILCFRLIYQPQSDALPTFRLFDAGVILRIESLTPESQEMGTIDASSAARRRVFTHIGLIIKLICSIRCTASGQAEGEESSRATAITYALFFRLYSFLIKVFHGNYIL